MTAADVSAFLDGIVSQQLAREDIGGAVVLVIKDGKVYSPKGTAMPMSTRKRRCCHGTLFRRIGVQTFHVDRCDATGEQGKLISIAT